MQPEIWAEKYRPTRLVEVINQKHVVERVKTFVKDKSIPHLLFAGPPGVGKTVVSLCIAHELYGNNWKVNTLETNASEERGIQVVRGKIKDFARTRAISDVPFKLIILDECLSGDTYVNILKDGMIEELKIKDVVEKNYHSKVLSVNEEGKEIFVDIERCIKIPHDEINGFFVVHLHDGRKISITGNHLLLTDKGWKRVDELKRGDKILSKLQRINNEIASASEGTINFNLKVLPRNIRFIERFIKKAPEIKVVEFLSTHKNGLTKHEISAGTNISIYKLNHIFSGNCYTPLTKLNIVKMEKIKKKFLYKLVCDKQKAIETIKKYKREKFDDKNQKKYVIDKLKKLGLLELKKDKAIIIARLLAHLFGGGGLYLTQRCLFFSGRKEDVETIKNDIESLGFHTHRIRHTKWKNGEVWSLTSFDKAFLCLMYSLGAPVGRKTDTIYQIPKFILKSDKEIKKAFLSSFFGSEGYKPMFQGSRVKPIYLKQRKREDMVDNLLEFLNQIALLLGEFNVKTKVRLNLKNRKERKGKTSTVEAELEITNSMENIINFLKNIGYTYCKYKEEIGKDALNYLIWRRALRKNAYSFKPIPYFNEWKEKYLKGDCCFYFVDRIKRETNPDYVYCLTTSNGKFIANDIVVHNCDALTPEAQNALRRTMEIFSQVCRFILITNYSSKIIEPIQSRCAVFRFNVLSESDTKKFIDRIANGEKLKLTEDAIKAIIEISEGDLRKVANLLQASASLGKKITAEVVYDVASRARPDDVKRMLNFALEGNFEDARKLLQDMLLKQGLSGEDVIYEIHRQIYNLPISEQVKVELVEKCGEYQFRISQGGDELIQLTALLAQFLLFSKK